jgi:putative intracellular protease/amidase
MTKNILIVLTSTPKIPSSGKPTGWYLPELAHPYEVFRSHKYLVTLTSPRGGEAPLDPSSVEAWTQDTSAFNFLSSKAGLWGNTLPFNVVDPVEAARDYDAIFFPGGHGPMFDLATDDHSIALVREFAKLNKPVAAVCHGPAAFVKVTFDDGKHLLAGRTVTGFSNKEEEQLGYSKEMPFELETELAKVAGKFVTASEPFGEKVVVDGNVITGQNPNSSRAIAEAVVKALGA